MATNVPATPTPTQTPGPTSVPEPTATPSPMPSPHCDADANTGTHEHPGSRAGGDSDDPSQIQGDQKNKIVYGTADGTVIQNVYIDRESLGGEFPDAIKVVIPSEYPSRKNINPEPRLGRTPGLLFQEGKTEGTGEEFRADGRPAEIPGLAGPERGTPVCGVGSSLFSLKKRRPET